MLWQQCYLSPLIQQIPNSLVAEQEVCMGGATLKHGIRKPESGNRLPESVLTRPNKVETAVHGFNSWLSV